MPAQRELPASRYDREIWETVLDLNEMSEEQLLVAMYEEEIQMMDQEDEEDEEEEVPEEAVKYWYQRYDLFSKYDEGIWMTESAWYGVTPEAVANTIAAQLAKAAAPEKTVLIDAFAGVGGNTIAFAKSGRWNQIFAIEKDPETLACAKHNAEIYGVSDQIFWIEGDCLVECKKRFSHLGKNAVIFGSPPWGGPSYSVDPVFDLSTMQPYNLETLYAAFSKVTKDIVLYLPRTSDLNQIVKLNRSGRKMPIRHYCMWGYSKALCAYYGNFTLT